MLWLRYIVALIGFTFCGPVIAQEVPPDRDPRNTVSQFLEAGHDGDFTRAMVFLEDRVSSEANAHDLYIALTIALPDLPGNITTQTSDTSVWIGEVELPSGPRVMLLRRQHDGTWKFSRESVLAATDILRQYPLADRLRWIPEWLRVPHLFEFATW